MLSVGCRCWAVEGLVLEQAVRGLRAGVEAEARGVLARCWALAQEGAWKLGAECLSRHGRLRGYKSRAGVGALGGGGEVAAKGLQAAGSW